MYFKALSLQLINSLISLVGSSGHLPSGSYCNNLLIKLFFLPSIYLILKSYNQIYASYLVIKALGKSVVAQFSYITKVFTSISTVKQILYKYICNTFLMHIVVPNTLAFLNCTSVPFKTRYRSYIDIGGNNFKYLII